MTALDNAVKRKTHKERAQPKGRKKLGLLEKKKDYKLRALDFQRKRSALNQLQQKAELRNEDEFYFGMHNTKTERGVHKVARTSVISNSLSLELARDLDKKYLDLKLAHETNQLHKLQSNLHFSHESVNTQIVFVDSDDEDDEIEEVKKPNEKAYAELERRRERVDLLRNAVKHVELKRQLEHKKGGRRQKVADSEGNRPAQYKWARERLR